MRVLLLSLFQPTEHNLKVPSSLPYYLAKYRPPEMMLDVLYYERGSAASTNQDKKLQRVFSAIGTLGLRPRLSSFVSKVAQRTNMFPSLKGVNLSFLPKTSDVRIIQEKKYDLVWVYPNILFPWYRALSDKRVVMTGPDCSLLHYQRLKKQLDEDPGLFPQSLRQVSSFRTFFERSYALEKAWAGSTALLHVVGRDDKATYDELSQESHCFFSPHPHSEYQEREGRIEDAGKRLTLLISGNNNSIYIGDLLNRMVDELFSTGLAEKYRFLIIGKGFEAIVKKLSKEGFQIEYYQWVEDYAATIKKAHIQLFPIAIGTGTKGKVLCAMVTGLLCIGTKFAFENILVDVQEDCLQIATGKELKACLEEISGDRQRYSAMADRAMHKARLYHSPAAAGTAFWDHVLKKLK